MSLILNVVNKLQSILDKLGNGRQQTQLVNSAGTEIGTVAVPIQVDISDATGITVDVAVSQVSDSIVVWGSDGAANRAMSTDAAGRVSMNPIAGQTGVAGGTGIDNANTQRVVLATNVGLPAGELQLGYASSSGNVVSVYPSVDTAIYASGDVLFIATEVTNFFRTAGGRALIHSITVLDVDEEAVAFDIIFCDTTQNFGALNAVAALADPAASNMPTLGHVVITAGDYIDIGGQRLVTLTSLGLTVQAAAASTSLFINGIVRATPTYTAATDLRIKIGYIYM